MPHKEQAQHDRMERIKIQVPASLKAELDVLRAEGTTVSGLIRSLLMHHFTKPQEGRKAG